MVSPFSLLMAYPWGWCIRHGTNIVYQSSSADPSCFVYARIASLGAQSTYYSWACGQSNGDVSVLVTTTGGKAPSQSPTTNIRNPTTDILGSIFPSDSGQASPTSSPGSTSSSKGITLSMGAIIGLSLVGFVILSAAITMCLCCYRRTRGRTTQRIDNPPQPTHNQIPYMTTVGNNSNYTQSVAPSHPNYQPDRITRWQGSVPLGPPPTVAPPPPQSVLSGQTLFSNGGYR